MPNIKLNGKEYPLATTLRVAFKVQGSKGHKPYMTVFQEIGEAPLEEQINLLFIAFECANKDSGIDANMFRETVLDEMDLAGLMTCIKDVISGIVGDTAGLQGNAQPAETPGSEQK